MNKATDTNACTHTDRHKDRYILYKNQRTDARIDGYRHRDIY